MEKVEYQEIFESVVSDFDQHFSAEHNTRILFSGKYGTGKTHFLTKFFKRFSTEIFPIVINPVHYSISSNDDIVRFVKYDILLTLLENGAKPDTLELTQMQYLPYFFMNDAKNCARLSAPLLEMIPLVGKPLSGVLDKVIDMVDEFKTKYKDAAKQLDDTKKVTAFMDTIDRSELKPFIDDTITCVIRGLIGQFREKKIVLVIDDLDRVDPEHIFRILNVFAAHLDSQSSNNRYHLDKVIIVCDIDNIRSVFHQKYGKDTDFTGYVDKFYSSTVFKFSPFEHFESILSIHINKQFSSTDRYGAATRVDHELMSIPRLLNYNKRLDLRNILTQIDVGYVVANRRIYFAAEAHSNPRNSRIIASFRLSTQLLGDSGDLLACLESIESTQALSEMRKLGVYIVALFEIAAVTRLDSGNQIKLILDGKPHNLRNEASSYSLIVGDRNIPELSEAAFRDLLLQAARKLKQLNLLD